MENEDQLSQPGTDTMPDTRNLTIRDLTLIGLICIITGTLILMPKYLGFDPFRTFFYAKNTGIIAFLGISLYTMSIKGKIGFKPVIILGLIFAVSAVFINLLPADESNQAVILSCIHLPLMLWCVYGIVFTGFDVRDVSKRVDFIKHNCNLAIMGALIVLAGMMLAGFTIALFQSIDLNIQNIYAQYIIVWGVVAAPAITAFIIYHYPRLTGSIAPIIATLFSPLILITLVIFLLAILFSGKDPYTDRDFLIIFNLMLLGVMAVIVFSISESSGTRKRRFNEVVLFCLSVVAMITDIVALSAIFYRLGEFGITPNRLAVVGSNILVLCNLVLITIDLFRVNFMKGTIERVNYTTARYLPVYMLWTIIVVFVFPLVF